MHGCIDREKGELPCGIEDHPRKFLWITHI